MKNNDLIDGRYSSQVRTFKRIVEAQHGSVLLPKILIVGCGQGYEALYMKDLFGTRVFGVDIDQKFISGSSEQVSLQNYDGHTLPYNDGIFNAVYSFHVLEHVGDVQRILSEIHRVLQPGGIVYIGTPNKSRLVGYFGMGDKTWGQKVRQNLRDWRHRLQGRFKNELGAHAGFTEKELHQLLLTHFKTSKPVTSWYYRFKWPKWRIVHDVLSVLHVDKLVVPSVYVLGEK